MQNQKIFILKIHICLLNKKQKVKLKNKLKKNPIIKCIKIISKLIYSKNNNPKLKKNNSFHQNKNTLLMH